MDEKVRHHLSLATPPVDADIRISYAHLAQERHAHSLCKATTAAATAAVEYLCGGHQALQAPSRRSDAQTC
jgi:hypothetical protein